ncbi:MAG TPA: HDOD domain-containing protein [Chitinispirillaceae bacterium]|nr:HDOD domain-containing protein [Chitinispirillaceae bacterium]
MDKKVFEKAVGHLPSFSPVIRHVLSVVNDPDSSSADVARVLRLDPVIAAKVLKLANSVYTGIQSKVSSLKNAVTFLGLKRISSLVLVYGFNIDSDCSTIPFSLKRFWCHSVSVALVAESIAKYLKRYGIIDTNEVFSAALLHDIGKLVLGVISPEMISSSHKRASSEKIPFYRAEDEKINHVNIGEKLADLWHLPADLQAAIAGHHWHTVPDNYLKLLSIIHISDIMVHILGYSVFENESIPVIEELALREIQLPVERLRVIVDTALEDKKKIESVLEIFET